LFLCQGVLIGIAIRTGSPLSLNLAEPVWKQVVGMKLSLKDVSEVDKVGGSLVVFLFDVGNV